jgi:probable HAF family extracellular repeat protein
MAAGSCWSQQYLLVNLGTLGGDYSLGNAINDSNQVAGTSGVPKVNGVSQDHPFLYSNGTMMDLGTLGGDYGLAYAINASGHVLGYSQGADGQDHAFFWNGTAQN